MSTDDLHRPLYLPDLLANALNHSPDRPLIQLAGGPMLSVRQVRDATSQFVQALASLGVARASRVATLSPNRPEVLHVAHSIQLLAAVGAPLNALGSLQDHLHILRDSEAEVLVFDAARFGQRAQEIAKELPKLKLIAFGSSPVAEDLCQLAERFTPAPLVPAKVEGTDIARLAYSGGTTGKPKSLATTQRIALSILQVMLSEWEWPSPLRMLSCAPLSHAASAVVLPTLLKQGTILIQPGFDPVAVMQAIKEYRINSMLVVPTMIYALLDHPRFKEFDLSSLETVFYGASAISPTRLKEAIEKIGPVFFQFYGQAEAPMVLTMLRKAEHDPNDLRRLASCGRPSNSIRLELMDDKLNPVKEGEPGEICVQGPIVMEGYRNNPELTAAAFKGGWLHTGDVAVRDPGGFLRIVDRTKDMIVSGGFNIYPRELEDIIGEHPAVAQAAVIGVPHPKWGEAVKALVVTREGEQVAAEALIELVSKRKGAYQAPKAVEFVASLPQTAVGKVDKKALRAQYGKPLA